MSLQFLVGGSGTGKTTYIYDQMIQKSMEKDHEPIIYLLPEQSNMLAEQEMVLRHPKGGTMDISILSFTRLSFMVFDELGIKMHDILDDFGKSMLIRKVLLSVDNQLSFYHNCSNKAGFVEEIKSVISEFFQYRVEGVVMERILNTLDTNCSLYYKMKDIHIIMDAFTKALENNYMIAEQVLSLLKEVAQDSVFLKNAAVYIDGFSGFTPVQYSVLEELLKLNCDLYVAFTMDECVLEDNSYGDNELFSLCKKEYIHLCNLAIKHQKVILPHISFTNHYRLHNNTSLLHLEQQLFRFPAVSYHGEVNHIHTISFPTKEKEIFYVARTIKEYVIEKKYQYKDFAIISTDLRFVKNDIKRYMEQLEIPYFLDCNEPLEHNPMLDAVGMLFDIYRSDFSYKSMFSFLKSGLLEIPMEDIYKLENYVIKYGVKGYHWWNQSFRGGVKGLKDINDTRARVMKSLGTLSNVFLKEKALGKEYVEVIYKFMVEQKMAEKLISKSKEYEAKHLIRESEVYSQIYGKWLEILDKTIDILGEELVERNALAKILSTGIASIKLGIIPSTLDQVVIGDMKRTRLGNIKILFVIGMNDGILPQVSNGAGLLLDKERRLLQEMDVSLAPDSVSDVFMQQYYFYLQIAKASEEIYFSYYKKDAKGAEEKESYFMKKILSIFPKLHMTDCEDGYSDCVSLTKGQMVSDFATQVMALELKDKSVYHVMEKYCNNELNAIMKGYLYHNNPSVLNAESIRQLYGTNMIYSVSKLENYSRCAYAFFLQYGLQIKKREEYKIERTNIGTILHTVMERFFSAVKEDGLSIKNMSDQQRNQFVELLTIEAAQKENETIFDQSYRNKHQLEILIRIAKRSVDNLCRHMEKGKLKPTYFEKEFSPEDEIQYIRMALEDDMFMTLKGIVDRVDVKETEDAVYYNIIDYKSGAKNIDYSAVYEGKQLQLIVYLNVMQEILEKQFPGKKVIPTGMYYYQLQDKIIDETDESMLEKKRMEAGRLTGLVNEDEVCRDLMDGKSGEVTPLRYKKDGELYSQNPSLVSQEEIQQLSKFVKNKMIEIGTEIIHGQIDMNPEKGERKCPCNYCDYKSICRFEPGLGGNRYRVGKNPNEQSAKAVIMNYGKEKEDELDTGSAKDN